MIIGEKFTKKNYHCVTEGVLKPLKRNIYFIENNIQNILFIRKERHRVSVRTKAFWTVEGFRTVKAT